MSSDPRKQCLVFNLFSKDWKDVTSIPNRSLVVIKVFLEKALDSSLKKVNLDTVKQTQTPQELINQAARVVSSHLQLKATTLIQLGGEESTLNDFSVIIKKGGSYYIVEGETVCQFFYLLDYEQTSIFQSNLTILNTKATIDKQLYQKFDSNRDSLPFAPQSAIDNKTIEIQGKIFLVKINDDGSFRFYRKHFKTSEGYPFRSTEEFDYLPGFGIISFASRVPFWIPTGELTETSEYYRFSNKQNRDRAF